MTNRHVRRPGKMRSQVSDAMQTQVVTVVPQMTVRELMHFLLDRDISGAPVVDPRGKIIGVVSVTDVLRLAGLVPGIPPTLEAWHPELATGDALFVEPTGNAVPEVIAVTARPTRPPAPCDEFNVGDIMTPVAYTIPPGAPLSQAVHMLLDQGIHRLLVMENGFLNGIITAKDVLAALEWD